MGVGSAGAALHEGDAVAEGKGNALGLAADAHVPAQLAVGVALLLDAHVHQGVLSEHAHGVQVRRLHKEAEEGTGGRGGPRAEVHC